METRSELASGAYGEFEGSAADRVVFGTYRDSGTWAPLLVSLIAERLLRGGAGTLLDVGAHIGLLTIPVVERSAAEALAFEPAPHSHALLRRNVLRHALGDRVRSYPLALAAQPGSAPFSLNEDNSGDCRLVLDSTACDSPERICVEVATLDQIVGDRALISPIVLKIDTQGAEVRVLRGAARTLPQIDYLVVEYWPAGLLRMGNRAEELHALLAQFPYGAFLNQAQRPDRLVPSGALLSALSWIATDGSDEGFVDLLFSRHAAIS